MRSFAPGERREPRGEDVAKVFNRELDKLSRLNPAAAEYSVQVNYIQTLLELPRNEYTTDNLDLENAKSVLDEDHYGLEEVKERILEHLAVLKLKGDLKSPILCLYGPHRWARPRWASLLPGHWAANMPACRWADCMTRRRSGGTARPTSEPCRAGWCRTSEGQALQIPSSSLTR